MKLHFCNYPAIITPASRGLRPANLLLQQGGTPSTRRGRRDSHALEDLDTMKHPMWQMPGSVPLSVVVGIILAALLFIVGIMNLIDYLTTGHFIW